MSHSTNSHRPVHRRTIHHNGPSKFAMPQPRVPWPSRAVTSIALVGIALTWSWTGCSSKKATQHKQTETQSKGIQKASLHKGPKGQLLAEANQRRNKNLPKFPVLTESLRKVTFRYVEPDKFRPDEMVLKALQQVQEQVASVQVRLVSAPDQKSGHAGSIEVTVGNKTEYFSLPVMQSPLKATQLFRRILAFITTRLKAIGDFSEKDAADLQYAAINGMLETLDPYSVLLKPEDFGEMSIRTHGSFGGIGIVISIRKGALTVIAPIDGTPAAKAGIKAGDRIVRIGEESTINMPLHEAVNRLRGRIGTKVTFWIERDGLSAPKKIDVVRAKIEIHSVTSKMLKGKIGYVRISRFSGNTRPELEAALAKVQKAGATSIVVDLSNNPGGLLSAAVAVVDAFVDMGTIVVTEGARGAQFEKWTAKKETTIWRKPIVVLVNRGSASAAEIVSGALKYMGRALVIGERTFGKGSVQVLMKNDDNSALKLTVARYLVRGDVPIQTIGVVPDLLTRPVIVNRKWIHLQPARIRSGEARLPTHLSPGRQVTIPKPRWTIEYLMDQAKLGKAISATGSMGAAPTILEMARSFLLEGAAPRIGMMDHMKAFVQRQRIVQQMRIVAAARRLGVDWRPAPSSTTNATTETQTTTGAKTETTAQAPKLQFTLTKSTGDKPVQAGSKLSLTLTVQNMGTAPVWRVRGVLHASEYYLDGREFLLGRIDPGKKRFWTIPVQLPHHEWNEAIPLRLTLYVGASTYYPKPRQPGQALSSTTSATSPSSDEKNASQVLTYLTVKQNPRPTFAVDYKAKELKGNGDGRLSKGETVQVLCRIKNTGPGPADNTVVTLRNQSGKAVYLEQGRALIKHLPSGRTARATVVFRLQNAVSKSLTFDLGVYHAKTRTGFSEKIHLNPAEPLKVFSGHIEPPTVTVDTVPLVTNRDKVSIKGVARHETHLKDLYVFVSNHKANDYRRKTFYMAAPGPDTKQLSFDTTVHLPLGMNTIIIMARSSKTLSGYRLLQVYRSAVLPASTPVRPRGQPRKP